MQTFLPYPEFSMSAECLDYRRLGKQRVEARQILYSLSRTTKWSNHPAVLMWKDYENALALYGNIIILEWIRRGYVNNMPLFPVFFPIGYPDWLGNKELHSSHRANLLRKYPEYYSKFSWIEEPGKNYFWPRRN